MKCLSPPSVVVATVLSSCPSRGTRQNTPLLPSVCRIAQPVCTTYMVHNALRKKIPGARSACATIMNQRANAAPSTALFVGHSFVQRQRPFAVHLAREWRQTRQAHGARFIVSIFRYDLVPSTVHRPYNSLGLLSMHLPEQSLFAMRFPSCRHHLTSC